jgi:hypothetical protein
MGRCFDAGRGHAQCRLRQRSRSPQTAADRCGYRPVLAGVRTVDPATVGVEGRDDRAPWNCPGRRRSWLYGACDLGGDRLSGEGWVVRGGDGSTDYEHVGTTLDGLPRRGYPALIVDRDAGRADTRDDGRDRAGRDRSRLRLVWPARGR